MALVSESMSVQVVDWMSTQSCLQRSMSGFTRFFHPGFTYSSIPPYATKNKQFEIFLSDFPQLDDFGVMCKRITCLNDTRKRLNFSVEAFLRALDLHTEMIKERMSKGEISPLSTDWIHVINFVQFCKSQVFQLVLGSIVLTRNRFFSFSGRMMHTFTRGWDETEFIPVIKIIVKYFALKKALTTILNARDVSEFTKLPLALEMRTRLTLRGLVWDLVGDDFAHRASWVLATINHLIGNHARQQAIFFLTVFGFVCEDSVDHWDEPSEMTVSQKLMFEELNNHTDWQAYIEWAPSDFHEGKNMFAVLSQAICSCMSYNQQWKDSILTDVLDEMFCIPGPWLRENIAGFLLFCSEQLIMAYVGDLIVTEDEEKLDHAARLVTDMIIMSHRFDNELSHKKGIGKVFDQVSVPLILHSDCHSCLYFFQLCLLGSHDLRLRFHSKIWEAIEDHLEGEDGLDLDETEVAFEILRTFGTHLMRNAFNEKSNDDGAADQNDQERLEE